MLWSPQQDRESGHRLWSGLNRTRAPHCANSRKVSLPLGSTTSADDIQPEPLRVHGNDHRTWTVHLGEVRKLTGKLAELVASGSAPDLVLNRHCGDCEFRDRCRKKAVENDDLSLLGGMTDGERKKLRSKGIFTVTQLSYTFRPRRRPKKLQDKRDKYRHSLKALAIREKKLHIVGNPQLKIEGTAVYLDVEGIVDIRQNMARLRELRLAKEGQVSDYDECPRANESR